MRKAEKEKKRSYGERGISVSGEKTSGKRHGGAENLCCSISLYPRGNVLGWRWEVGSVQHRTRRSGRLGRCRYLQKLRLSYQCAYVKRCVVFLKNRSKV